MTPSRRGQDQSYLISPVVLFFSFRGQRPSLRQLLPIERIRNRLIYLTLYLLLWNIQRDGSGSIVVIHPFLLIKYMDGGVVEY